MSFSSNASKLASWLSTRRPCTQNAKEYAPGDDGYHAARNNFEECIRLQQARQQQPVVQQHPRDLCVDALASTSSERERNPLRRIKRSSHNATGYLGVTKCWKCHGPQPWRARVRRGGKVIYQSYHKTAAAASLAREAFLSKSSEWIY